MTKKEQKAHVNRLIKIADEIGDSLMYNDELHMEDMLYIIGVLHYKFAAVQMEAMYDARKITKGK